MSADPTPVSWWVEREMLGTGRHMPTVWLHQTAGSLMFSFFIFLSVSFSFRIPFNPSLCFSVFFSPLSWERRNKCTRFQRLILPLTAGEPNMWGQLWKEGDTSRERECKEKEGQDREEGDPATDGRSDETRIGVLCCWGGGGWQAVETWETWRIGRKCWHGEEGNVIGGWNRWFAGGYVIFGNGFPHKWLCPTGFFLR